VNRDTDLQSVRPAELCSADSNDRRQSVCSLQTHECLCSIRVCRCKLSLTSISAKMRTALISAGLVFTIFSAIMNAEKPFNFEETPGKLPKEVVPMEYSVRIIPDIGKFTLTGTETVKLNVRSPVRRLVLNALELEVAGASIDGQTLPESAIEIDQKNELLTLALPSCSVRSLKRPTLAGCFLAGTSRCFVRAFN